MLTGYELEERGDHCQLVTFSHITVPHACSTRLSGFSAGPFASLNLGLMSGDDRAIVERNRERFSQLVGFRVEQNLLMDHGIEVVHIEQPSTPPLPADACITANPQVTLSITTADCVPIFFHDPETKTVGLAHAGWRGTVNGIARATVDAMIEKLGARAEKLHVGLGPAIGPCCFEVDQDVAEPFRREFGPDTVQILENGKWSINLHHCNRIWLERAGVLLSNIKTCPLCTSCRHDLFYSYRRDRGQTGRLLSAIAIKSFD
jgi:YfiH family protein